MPDLPPTGSRPVSRCEFKHGRQRPLDRLRDFKWEDPQCLRERCEEYNVRAYFYYSERAETIASPKNDTKAELDNSGIADLFLDTRGTIRGF